jgi:dTDP-4-dehydrorhamnose 3,5-epimerase
MKIEPATIEGIFVITPDVHEDERGFFMESYRQDELAKAGIVDTFVQDNHSRSLEKNTMRGLHFQYEAPMAKLMRVTRGSAFLVAVDLRKDSPTFGKWFGVEASEENKKMVYAPPSFARGFQTLTDMCEVQYKCSAFYNKAGAAAIRWDDADVGIDWPIKETPILSKDSASAGSLKEWIARPESDVFA